MHFVPRHDRIRVLLIEDDEDDYLLTTSLLSEIKGQSYDVHWSKNYPTGLAAATQNEHDVCLVDYRLGAHDGIGQRMHDGMVEGADPAGIDALLDD